MTKKRIPLNAMQKAVYEMLTSYQATPVYDDVPSEATMPYITFGLFTAKPNGSKTTDISDVTLQFDIWSSYSGKSEVNGIAEDILEVVTGVQIDLSGDDFKVMNQEYSMFESFPSDEDGYHGVITFNTKVQNLRA